MLIPASCAEPEVRTSTNGGSVLLTGHCVPLNDYVMVCLFLLVGPFAFRRPLQRHPPRPCSKGLCPGLLARTPRGSHRTSRPTTSGDASSMPAGAEMEVRTREPRSATADNPGFKLYMLLYILTGWVPVLGTEERTPMRRKSHCAHQRTITITST